MVHVDFRSAIAADAALLAHASGIHDAIIFSLSPSGGCRFANAMFTTVTGAPVRAAAGFGWLHFVHADDRELCHASFLVQAEARGPWSHVCRLRTRTGDYAWMIAAGAAVRLTTTRFNYVAAITGVRSDVPALRILTRLLGSNPCSA